MRARIVVGSLISLSFAASCSSPIYVLHERPKSGVFSSSDLRTPISYSGKIALLYDREPWLRTEPVLQDGSAWVYSTIVVKNSGSEKIQLMAKKVRLELAGVGSVPAEYSAEDQVSTIETVEGANYYRLTVRFKLPSAWLSRDEETPFELVVPFQSFELRLRYWLWAV